MSGDLISLQVLLVSGHQPFRDLWRESGSAASVPLEFHEADVPAALGKLTNGAVDIAVIDDALVPSDCAQIIAAARSHAPAPYIMVAARNGSCAIDGADTVVASPENRKQVQALMERCIRTRIPTRALVVDDSGTMRSIVKKVLSGSHYAMEVSEAKDGSEAIEKVQKLSFDLVILDYNMPGQNGLDVLAAIKKQQPGVCVVMMSTNVDAVIAKQAQMSGASGFLMKPFYPADIDKVLDRFFAAQIGTV